MDFSDLVSNSVHGIHNLMLKQFTMIVVMVITSFFYLIDNTWCVLRCHISNNQLICQEA